MTWICALCLSSVLLYLSTTRLSDRDDNKQGGLIKRPPCLEVQFNGVVKLIYISLTAICAYCRMTEGTIPGINEPATAIISARVTGAVT